uniref:Dead/deah box helicase domain-containing protein (DeaD) n=1 Tax=uncultured marine group II/III euryarchaeote KM3_83_G03 TaxID=1456522 RepID=A0A075HY00_9EURY|nr:dead/deah box helicase domain-containing protein (deaD) [uncultured marine group II/III euryarchaeote KM3_83_G03]
MTSFVSLGLKKEIRDVLASEGFKEMTEVQEKIIPLTMQGKNVVFTSMTGSGKTLAYTVGFLKKINTKLNIQVLIMVPTRELCVQIYKELKKICEPLGIRVGALYGGRDASGDYRTTSQRNHVMVGTPGRLIQHVNKKKIKIGDVKCLIYDESDQMFNNGFYGHCAYAKERASKDAQIILSSATITEEVERFIEEEVGTYELVKVGAEIPESIVQEKIYCDKLGKNDIVRKYFTEKKFKRAIIFCNTRIKSASISKFLKDNGYNAQPINGDMEQRERTKILNLFKEGKVQVLVGTDVAARGLHIEDVDIVINYDVPTKPEFYVHRIGRTGRRDKNGYALTLICPEDKDRFYDIEVIFGVNAKNVS